MKATFIILTILALVPATAMAQTKKKKHHAATPAAEAPKEEAPAERSGAVANEPDTDGCGLGWQVTDKKTIMASITRGTTNGVVPPSFGMTSGTLGCAKHPFAKKDQAAAVYAISNYDSLRLEMAEGRGEVVEGFARTLGCSDVSGFGREMQKSYGEILGGKPTAIKLFENVKQQIRKNPALASSCNA